MNIKFKNGEHIDTHSLLDKEAAITEAVAKLYEVCEKYNATALLRVLLNKDKFIGMNYTTSTKTDYQKESDFLYNSIGEYISNHSKGKVILVRNPK